jgi:hypothetical protein
MKIVYLLMLAILGVSLAGTAAAAECHGDELQVSFSNIRTVAAFALIADAAGLRPQIDSSIDSSGPLKFECTPWRVAAERLARKYNLRLRVEGGVMYVSRESSAH